MGDSITEGQYIGAPHRWVDIVSNHFGGGVVQFFHSGVSGDTSRQGLERFPKAVQILEPSIVFIQFGHNDCNFWATDNGCPRVSLTAFEENLKEMFKRSILHGAQDVFYIAPHPTLIDQTFDSETSYEDSRRDYVLAMERVAEELSCPLIDPSHEFLGYDLSDLLLLDNIHLSTVGHQVYSDMVIGFLTPFLSSH